MPHFFPRKMSSLFSMKLSGNSIVPLGLFIASSLSKDFFGKLSREEMINVLGFIKKAIFDGKLDIQGINLKDWKKTLNPILYTTSLLSSIYINEKSKISHQKLKESVDKIERMTLKIKEILDEKKI